MTYRYVLIRDLVMQMCLSGRHVWSTGGVEKIMKDAVEIADRLIAIKAAEENR